MLFVSGEVEAESEDEDDDDDDCKKGSMDEVCIVKVTLKAGGSNPGEMALLSGRRLPSSGHIREVHLLF